MPAGSRGGPRLTPDLRRLLAVQALRAFVYGLGSVILGVTLERRGLSGLEVGVVLSALLAGAALVSLVVARYGDRLGRRRTYLALLILLGAAGGVFALTGSVPALALAALTGTVSTDVVESGPFTSLEQAMLPHAAAERDPARLFGLYNTIATIAGSLGALAAGGPTLTGTASERWLLAYPVAAVLALAVAARLSPAVEAGRELGAEPRPALDRSRRIVAQLSALFAVDSFGGGFVVQAFIAYWFARRFDTPPETLGAVFFGVGILQALSFQAALRLASRIGLLRTMVFTHLPSNVLLAAIAFAPNETTAIVLLLARFALSQMDVPARQAFVVTVVDPSERTAAAGYTNAARYVTRPIAPLVARPPRPGFAGRSVRRRRSCQGRVRPGSLRTVPARRASTPLTMQVLRSLQVFPTTRLRGRRT